MACWVEYNHPVVHDIVLRLVLKGKAYTDVVPR